MRNLGRKFDLVRKVMDVFPERDTCAEIRRKIRNWIRGGKKEFSSRESPSGRSGTRRERGGQRAVW